MKVTVAISTGRTEPRVDWLVRGLGLQAIPGDEIEVLVIDVLNRSLDELRIGDLLDKQITSIQVHSPKPTIWQGKHRATSCDWWALSNARNTALCLASHDYIVFSDDRTKLGLDWLKTVRQGELTRASVIAGSYQKWEDDPNAPAGIQAKFTDDHRRNVKPEGLVNCGGGWLFGCAIAMPLEWALEVNGFEEGCDGLGMEDVIFGLNLQNAGRRIDFVPSLFAEQDRVVKSFGPVYRKTDKGVSPNDKSHAALTRFGKKSRTEFTPDLRALRKLVIDATYEQRMLAYPVPAIDQLDWYDGQPISEMT